MGFDLVEMEGSESKWEGEAVRVSFGRGLKGVSLMSLGLTTCGVDFYFIRIVICKISKQSQQ